MMYGWQLSSYRTVGRALLTIISLQIGIFNYDEVLIFPFICICQAGFVMLILILQCFPGSEWSPPARWIPVWFLHRVHVVYGAQSPHISNPGGILQGANTSQGKYFRHNQIKWTLGMYIPLATAGWQKLETRLEVQRNWTAPAHVI